MPMPVSTLMRGLRAPAGSTGPTPDRERVQDDPLHDGEDRRVRPDRQRERQPGREVNTGVRSSLRAACRISFPIPAMVRCVSISGRERDSTVAFVHNGLATSVGLDRRFGMFASGTWPSTRGTLRGSLRRPFTSTSCHRQGNVALLRWPCGTGSVGVEARAGDERARHHDDGSARARRQRHRDRRVLDDRRSDRRRAARPAPRGASRSGGRRGFDSGGRMRMTRTHRDPRCACWWPGVRYRRPRVTRGWWENCAASTAATP